MVVKSSFYIIYRGEWRNTVWRGSEKQLTGVPFCDIIVRQGEKMTGSQNPHSYDYICERGMNGSFLDLDEARKIIDRGANL